MENKIEKWFKNYQARLIILSMTLMFLFLLRSAGYFQPYLTISVNFIVMIGLVMAIFLLDARSKVFFSIAIIFWIFASVVRSLGVIVWAERIVFYTFESLIIGVVLMIVETIFHKYRQ